MSRVRAIVLSIAIVVSVVAIGAKPQQSNSATIYGSVLCEGKPLAGVAVSDGVNIVKTDSLGNYALKSHKFQNTVFVITPSGYEPICKKRILG